MEKLKEILSKWEIYIFGRSSYRPGLDDLPVILESIFVVFVLAYFFYKSFLAVIFLLPAGMLYMKGRFEDKNKKKKNEIRLSFKDLILTVSSNLNAGYSIENAFRESLGNMILLHGKDSPIVRELKTICRGMDNNKPFEEMLVSFAERSGVDEIREFADIFTLAKKSGGRLNTIISQSAVNISGRMEVENEIQLLISSKKYEQKIMNMVPFFILAYIGATSKGYFDILYGNILGIGVMTGCLAAYIFSYRMAGKIVNIEV